MDGVQAGQYPDGVFVFRAELGVKIVLGEVAAEAGILCGERQVCGLRTRPQLQAWGQRIQDPARWPPRLLSDFPLSPWSHAVCCGKPFWPPGLGGLLVPPLLSVYLSIFPRDCEFLEDRAHLVLVIFAFLALGLGA